MKRLAPLALLALAACAMPTPKAAIKMHIFVQLAGGGTASVKINGAPHPGELDAMTLPFDPTLKPASWPPPGAQLFSPTVAQHGKDISSLTLALNGDIVFVRTEAHGTVTTGAIRLTVAGPDGSSYEFDSAEKRLDSGLGRAEHSVTLMYRKRK